jgi:hypothetical protein
VGRRHLSGGVTANPQGNIAIYSYDAVGNLLGIQRVDAPPQGLAITYVSPGRGLIGAPVMVFGKGSTPSPPTTLCAFLTT